MENDKNPAPESQKPQVKIPAAPSMQYVTESFNPAQLFRKGQISNHHQKNKK